MRSWQQQYRLIRPLIIRLMSKRYLMLIALCTFIVAIACDPRPESFSSEKAILETLDIKNQIYIKDIVPIANTITILTQQKAQQQ